MHALSEIGLESAPSLPALAEKATIIFTSLPSDGALDQVVQGQSGLAQSVRPSTIVVELSTLSLAARNAIGKLSPRPAP